MKKYRKAMAKLAAEIRFCFPCQILAALDEAMLAFDELYREHKFTRDQVLRTTKYFCKVSRWAHGNF